MDKDQATPQALPGDDDLLALRAADRYFDFLAAGQTPVARDDVAPELTSLFTEWRMNIGAAPIPPTPTLDSLLGLSDDVPAPQPAATSAAAGDGAESNVVDITKHPRFTSWRREAVRAVSGAAAFLILAAGGLTIAIQSAGLNDPLWSVNRALFTSNANDIELATYLNQDIDRARSLADSGQEQEAMRVLDRVQTKLDGIGAESRRDDVQKRLNDTRKAVNGATEEGTTSEVNKAGKSTNPSTATSSTSGASTTSSSTSVEEESTEHAISGDESHAPSRPAGEDDAVKPDDPDASTSSNQPVPHDDSRAEVAPTVTFLVEPTI